MKPVHCWLRYGYLTDGVKKKNVEWNLFFCNLIRNLTLKNLLAYDAEENFKNVICMF